MFFRIRLKAKRNAAAVEEETRFTPENSGLTESQISSAKVSARALHISMTKEDAFTRPDMVQCLYTLGLNPTDDSIDGKLRTLKIHQNTYYSFGHVCHVWSLLLKDVQDEEEMLMKAFQFFDKDGNGEISITELKTTMHELGDLLTEAEIQLFVSLMDGNNDGVIGFSEFIKTLKSQAPGEDSSRRSTADDHSRLDTTETSVRAVKGGPTSTRTAKDEAPTGTSAAIDGLPPSTKAAPEGAAQEACLDVGLASKRPTAELPGEVF